MIGYQGICECGQHAWATAGKTRVALVSPCDAKLIKDNTLLPLQGKKHRTSYVQFRLDGKKVYLHRIIMNASLGEEVDHKNNYGLDNTRENLRISTRVLNSGNRPKTRRSKWPYKGIRFKAGKWLAHIGIDYKAVHLGTFDTAIETAMAYDAAAKKQFGEFAKLNLEG